MKSEWTLEVEGLGKIKQAAVRVKPLTLFVGENNTGKSYLASVLWGVVSLPSADSTFEFGNIDKVYEDPSYKRCDEYLSALFSASSTDRHTVIPEEIKQASIDWFNNFINSKSLSFAGQLFNKEGFEIGRIKIKNCLSEKPLSILYTVGPDEYVLYNDANNSLDICLKEKEEIDRNTRFALNIIIARQSVFSFAFAMDENPIPYLPASRTGFTLLYKSLIKRQIRQLSVANRTPKLNVDVTLPMIKFLELLASYPTEGEGDYVEEAELLEGLIQGSLAQQGGSGVNEFFYQPQETAKLLPLSLSSSLIGELAPLIFVLRHAKNLPALVIEEPEVHLHPAIQVKLAKIIARLIRKGVSVWISTHSENFCQQINNLIKVGMSPRRDELQREIGYDPNEYLLSSEVSAYQFVNNGATSEVTPAEITADQGFVMPTFNKVLENLVQEVTAIDRFAKAE